MRKEPAEKNIHLCAFSAILVLSLTLTIFGGFSTKTYGTEYAPAADVYSKWRLVIDGAVGNPLRLSLNDLAAMPKAEVNGAIYCGISMGASGNWGGVKISHLLKIAAVDIAATNLEFRADDGYAINVAVEAALQQGLIIAYDLDGQPLVEVLRLTLPGYPGNFWISTITKITVTTSIDYNIGPNYYTAQLGGGHPESSPTPQPTAAPKPTPFRLPTPPPVQQPTSTPQPTQMPILTESVPTTVFPSLVPAQPETQPTDKSNVQLFNEPQNPEFSPNSNMVSYYIYLIVFAAVVVSLAAGLIFLKCRQNRKKRV